MSRVQRFGPSGGEVQVTGANVSGAAGRRPAVPCLIGEKTAKGRVDRFPAGVRPTGGGGSAAARSGAVRRGVTRR